MSKPKQPDVTVTPAARPKRVDVGIRTVLDQLAEPDKSTKAARAALTDEHRKRLDTIAKLAKQLREELDALAELEPKES